jgi:hypothetical protein
MRFENKVLKNGKVELDGNEYINCEFRNCKLIYRGKLPPKFEKCSFVDYKIALRECAANVANFLTAFGRIASSIDAEQAAKGEGADDDILDAEILDGE